MDIKLNGDFFMFNACVRKVIRHDQRDPKPGNAFWVELWIERASDQEDFIITGGEKLIKEFKIESGKIYNFGLELQTRNKRTSGGETYRDHKLGIVDLAIVPESGSGSNKK